jgi:hypothetical protein
MHRIPYLGHIVDEHGVHVDETNIQVTCNSPTPQTLIKLHNFMGLTKFYHRFMLGFSHIAFFLIQMSKGGSKAKFVWAKLKQKSFEDLKHHLCSTQILVLVDLQ